MNPNIDRQQITHNFVVEHIPIRKNDTYKNKMGHVLCIGGDAYKGGAILLTSMAAVYSGAGLVTVATHPDNKIALNTLLPEAMYCNYTDYKSLINLIQKVDSIVIGPGLGTSQVAQLILETTLTMCQPHQSIIIDADALTILSQAHYNLSSIKADIILTPHAGEWERLTHTSINNEDENFNFQDTTQAYLVLKGAPTRIISRSTLWTNTVGNPGQATGGMGDCLSGIIASLQNQYVISNKIYSAKEIALVSAVYLHSYVADQLAQTHYVTLPTEIIHSLPIFMRKMVDEYANNKNQSL